MRDGQDGWYHRNALFGRYIHNPLTDFTLGGRSAKTPDHLSLVFDANLSAAFAGSPALCTGMQRLSRLQPGLSSQVLEPCSLDLSERPSSAGLMDSSQQPAGIAPMNKCKHGNCGCLACLHGDYSARSGSMGKDSSAEVCADHLGRAAAVNLYADREQTALYGSRSRDDCAVEHCLSGATLAKPDSGWIGQTDKPGAEAIATIQRAFQLAMDSTWIHRGGHEVWRIGCCYCCLCYFVRSATLTIRSRKVMSLACSFICFPINTCLLCLALPCITQELNALSTCHEADIPLHLPQ